MNNIQENASTIPFRDIEMIAETWARERGCSAQPRLRCCKGHEPDSEMSTRLYGLIENAVNHPTVSPAELERWANQQTSRDTTHQIIATVPIW